MERAESPWYREGLAFECTRCGHCCTGPPGYVWLSPNDLSRLVAGMGGDEADFRSRFTREVNGALSLIEKSDHSCVFWDEGEGCTVYELRPVQCRTWPFWPQNLENRDVWERARRVCPGAGSGVFFSLEEIEAQARRAADAMGIR